MARRTGSDHWPPAAPRPARRRRPGRGDGVRVRARLRGPGSDVAAGGHRARLGRWSRSCSSAEGCGSRRSRACVGLALVDRLDRAAADDVVRGPDAPNARGRSARSLEFVGQQARIRVAPTAPLPPLLLAGVTAIWTASFSIHALAIRAGSPLLAVLPPIALVGFADTVLEDGARPIYAVTLLAAALAVVFADGIRRVRQWGPMWSSRATAATERLACAGRAPVGDARRSRRRCSSRGCFPGSARARSSTCPRRETAGRASTPSSRSTPSSTRRPRATCSRSDADRRRVLADSCPGRVRRRDVEQQRPGRPIRASSSRRPWPCRRTSTTCRPSAGADAAVPDPDRHRRARRLPMAHPAQTWPRRSARSVRRIPPADPDRTTAWTRASSTR